MNTDFPVIIYLLKFNNTNTRKRCETCSKLTLETPKWPHWLWTGKYLLENIIFFWYIHAFYKQRFFFNSVSVLLNFFMNELQMLLNAYEQHHTATLFIFTMLALMSRLRSIYVASLWFILYVHLHFHYFKIILWIQTHLFLYLFFRICPIIFGW